MHHPLRPPFLQFRAPGLLGDLMSRVTLSSLRRHKENGERFARLTAYDARFARLIEDAGVEVILVGDSLGNVVQGRETTLPVTMDQMVYHTACVARGCERALIVADLPFMSCATPEDALHNAARLMKEGQAHVVKLEGGAVVLDTVRRLTEQGIPVCGHLGLLPQSVHKLSGYRVQGRDEVSAEAIVADARALAQAGADMLVLESVPAALARQVAQTVAIPVIGIGAGAEVDAQVLVLYDLLGITPRPPKFAKDFVAENDSIAEAVAAYVRAVQAGEFPGPEHTFS